MNKQNETISLDRSLQKLEYEMEWKMERTLKIRQRIIKDIKKGKRRSQLQKGFVLFTTFALISMFVFLLAGQLTGKLNTMDLSTLPAGEELHTIADEEIPELQSQLEELHQVQFKTPSGREITIHTQENEWGSVDNAIAVFMNHPKYPSLSYTTKEITISNQRAVLQEPVPDAKVGSYKLYVFTESYVYYVQFVAGHNDKGDRDELLKIAEQFNYENL
ncbi:hypothetical protein [Ferdinandcohnia sp. SAFN-114]|uniref:hypothetical protein n=1 Tax=Ferdinandcohnia sp. SAFN-114 TaxID=3387275 RepID=UPI003F7D3FBB